MPNKCATPNQLERWLLGNVSAAEADVLEQHLDGCVACESVVAGLDHVTDGLVVELRKAVTGPPHRDARAIEHILQLVSEISSPSYRPDRMPLRGNAKSADELSAPPLVLRDYQLLEKIGQGGMGSVYKARHVRLDRIVAVKLISHAPLQDVAAVERFQREAQIAGQVDHPNIVRATDAGEVNGMYYLVMEYVDGIDTAKLLQQRGRLSADTACRIISQAAMGLHHAHQLNLVHRDIKPSNIIVTKQHQVKVLDLGIARWIANSRANEDLTAGSDLVGTLDYIAPEQIDDSRSVDARADIYSLGCTLYHYLSGSTPFASASRLKKLDAHQRDQPPALDKLIPELPMGLVQIVSKMMSKSPQARFQTAADVAASLQPYCEETQRRSGIRSVTSATPRTDPVLPSSAAIPVRASGRKLTYLLWLVSICGLAVLAWTIRPLVWKTFDDDIPNETASIEGTPSAETLIERTADKNSSEELSPSDASARDENPFEGASSNKSRPIDAEAVKTSATEPPPIEVSSTHGKTDADADQKLLSKKPRADLGGPVISLPGHIGSPENIAFGPSGNWAVSADKEHVHIWNIESRTESSKFKVDYYNSPVSVAVSPVGDIFATAGGIGSGPEGAIAEVRLYQSGTNKLKTKFPLPSFPTCISFSADGMKLAASSTKGVAKVWNLTDEQLITEFAHGGPVNSLAFSSDGELLVTGGADASVRLWNIPQKRQEREFIGHKDSIGQVAVSKDGKRVLSAANNRDSGSRDRTARIWDLETGEPLGTVNIGNGSVVAFSLDGSLMMVGQFTGEVAVWNMLQQKQIACYPTQLDQPIWSLAISTDLRQALAANRYGRLTLYRLPATE